MPSVQKVSHVLERKKRNTEWIHLISVHLSFLVENKCLMQRLRHKFAAFWHQARAARDGEEILTAELLAITKICLCEAVCTKKNVLMHLFLYFYLA